MTLTILKSNATCNLIIPFMGDNLEGLVSPGQEITVPEKAMACDFVKNLLSIGELIKVGEVIEEEPEEDGGVPMEELRNRAIALGIQPSDRWSRAKLQSEIDKAA